MEVYDELEKALKEIKRLKEEYMILQNASDEVEEEKDKEIERLKHREKELKYFNDILENQNIEKSKEIERLNNIINKAIEYIEENKTIHECNEYGFDNMLEDVIPLLNILKGSGKE